MGSLTLIIGGARSGKSRAAQELAARLAAGRPVAYIATAEAGDDEMRERIARHRQSRPANWMTIEEPRRVTEALRRCDTAAVILIDCLTLYITNHLLDLPDGPYGHGDGWDVERAEAAIVTLIQVAQSVPADVIVVSNEVGLGLVPETPLGRVFRDVAGRANQAMAAAADRVVFMVAGLPSYLKGAPA
jgi:adenosylcobinamide kinase/adenosylcobinamide-phosphate guanylyltransferase